MLVGIGGNPSRGQTPTTRPSVDKADVAKELIRIHKSADTESIQVTVEMDRSVTCGAAAEIELRLINNRKEAILCPHDADGRDFHLKLIDNQDRVVPATELGRASAADPYTFQSNVGLRVGPGEEIVRRYDINNFFQITRPGQYRLDVLKVVDSIEGCRSIKANLGVYVDGITFNVK